MNDEKQSVTCAINYLQELKNNTSGYGVSWLDMAIKALEDKGYEQGYEDGYKDGYDEAWTA